MNEVIIKRRRYEIKKIPPTPCLSSHVSSVAVIGGVAADCTLRQWTGVPVDRTDICPTDKQTQFSASGGT